MLKKIQVFQDMTPYTLENINQCSGGTCFLHLQDGSRTALTYPKLEAASFFETLVNT
jgi:hypothetical protein